MVTDKEFQELRNQVEFLYRHFGVSYAPPPLSEEDAHIAQEIKNANLMGAIKIHQELHNSSLKEAQQYVRELALRLGKQ